MISPPSHLLRFLFCLLLGGLLPATLQAGPLALQDGEQMTFRVGWGLFIGAGEIRIAARTEELKGRPQLRVVTTTATGGLLRTFFPFDARSESIFDPRTGRIQMSTESSQAKYKQTSQSLVFDYTHRRASYINDVDPAKSAVLAVPPGEPMDLIMSLVQTRNWKLKPGEKQDALVIFDNDFYELTLHAERYETLITPLGTFQTLLLVPRMEKTPPKGMFKRGSNVRVWISQDARHLPVRFEVEFKFGVGVATLVDYTPPGAAQPTPPAVLAAGPEDEANPGS
ncbi:MAG: DUF3108 domain-containing protein [Opitutales bacterium]